MAACRAGRSTAGRNLRAGHAVETLAAASSSSDNTHMENVAVEQPTAAEPVARWDRSTSGLLLCGRRLAGDVRRARTLAGEQSGARCPGAPD